MVSDEALAMHELDEINVCDYITHCLVDCGVTHVFGGHGGAVVPLIDAICRHPKLTWVYTRIEVSASLAAAAHAKLSDTLGCCIGTSGPGASHLLTGLIDAELDRVPVLCLTGMKKTYTIGYSDFQDINQTDLFKAAGISFSQKVIHHKGVVPLLRDAIATALTNAVCSHLAIPIDVQQAMIQAPPCLSKCSAGGDLAKHCMPASSDIQKVADFLLKAMDDRERMLFAIGHRGVGETAAYVLDIAETLGVPIVTTMDAKGSVPEDHDQVVGVLGVFGNSGLEASAELVATATLIVSFGVDDHTQLVVGADGTQNTRLIEIDRACLLDMRFQAVMILTGDIPYVTKALSEEISVRAEARRNAGDEIAPTKSTAVLDSLGGLTWGKTACLNEMGFQAEALHKRSANYSVPADQISKGFCHPGMVMQRLGKQLQQNAIIAIDVGDCALWSGLCLCLNKEGQRMIASMRMGTMGYSIYGAMGAAAFDKKLQIVGIAGDGAFQMATQELATLRQMEANVVFIVFNNGKLGRVHNEIWGPADADKPYGCEIESPDFVKLAKAHGGQGIRLSESDEGQIDKGLQEAFANSGITIVEVIQDPDVKPCMHKKKPLPETPAHALKKPSP